MPRSIRHRHSPAEGRARDREVPETGPDEADDLVAPAFGLNEFRVGLVELQQPVLVGGKPKKVALLLHPFDGRARRRELLAIVAGAQLRFVEIGLIAYRVPTGI